MNFLGDRSAFPVKAVAILSLTSPLLFAQQPVNSTYSVGSKVVVSVTNNYGPITVKPSSTKQVVVRAVPRSPQVRFEDEQHGNRIELTSRSQNAGDNLAEYFVQVPSGTWVMLKSSGGTLHVEQISGDIVMEATTGAVEASLLNGAHLHIKTLSGPVRLSSIHDSKVEVRSISGSITMHDVTGLKVEAHTGTGRIAYDGNPGDGGEYLLTTHNGDLDVSVPHDAPVQIKSVSLKQDDLDVPQATPAPNPGNSIFKEGFSSMSRFIIRSFSGKIHLQRP